MYIGDNTDSNDITLRAMLKDFLSSIKQPETRRARCLGYIINLVAQAFLFSKDIKAFKAVTSPVDDNKTIPFNSEAINRA